MVKAYARPEKEGYVLVTFFYGEGQLTQARYTDWDQSVSGATSEPRMSLDIPDNGGTFDKKELRIILPTDAFTSRAGSGVPHSPIYVTVEEITQGLATGDQTTQKVLYRGRVTRTVQNFQGRNNKVGFFSLSIKSRLDISMGLPCNHHCAWTVFHGGCGVSESTFDALGEIDSRDGTEITVTSTGVTTPGGTDARYWKRGYLQKDGLRIAIRDYDGDTDVTKLYTARPVPLDWVGGTADIIFVPGCDKTVETCRARYNGEEFFMGMGYAIPAYQPNFESPS